MPITLVNCRIFDGKNTLDQLHSVNICKQKITTITAQETLINASKVCNTAPQNCFDLAGYTLMPGLIDAHVHLMAHQVDLNQQDAPEALIYTQAVKFMENMVQRGFTTVRDAGGAQSDLVTVAESGLINAPRLFISGLALSQTGGHGDFRSQHNHCLEPCSCSVNSGSKISILCDGITGVRKAARQQLRQGATQIKIMASGGVASPTDRINNLQFSKDEIAAIVEEADNFGCYVMAHAYTPKGMQRCLELGVRSLEHGNLLDHATAKRIVHHQAYLVPTLVIYQALYQQGKQYGFPEESLAKLSAVREQGLNALAIAMEHGVKLGFGTDLLGPLGRFQDQEFALRAKVQTPIDILRSATSINAELLCQEDTLGRVVPGYEADLIAVKGCPDLEIDIMSKLNDNVHLVLQRGNIVKATDNFYSPSNNT